MEFVLSLETGAGDATKKRRFDGKGEQEACNETKKSCDDMSRPFFKIAKMTWTVEICQKLSKSSKRSFIVPRI